MDFKVAGSGLGITALQMDIKVKSVSRAVLEKALEQARLGRREILKKMLAAVPRPVAQISPYAPRMELIQIPPDKIGYLIGPGGRQIKALQEKYKVKISILDENGNVQVAGVDREMVNACLDVIRGMCETPKIGTKYSGTVKGIKDFGAFVEILPGVEGLLHVSELAEGYVNRVTDVVNVGDTVEVVVIHVDDRGKIKLSRRALLAGGEGGGPPDEGGDDGPFEGEGDGGNGGDEFGDRPAELVEGGGPREERHDRGGRRGGFRGGRGRGRGGRR
jgi:polyribonucleotide nucleotidyltransferase